MAKKKTKNASKKTNTKNITTQVQKDTGKATNLVKENKKATQAIKTEKKTLKKSVDKKKKPNIFLRAIIFLNCVLSELKKVTWLNKQELVQHTGIVAGVVTIFTLLTWVVDTGLGALAALFLNV